MCEQLVKYYTRSSQADLDKIAMQREGWVVLSERYSRANDKFEVTYQIPERPWTNLQRQAAA